MSKVLKENNWSLRIKHPKKKNASMVFGKEKTC